MAQATVLTDSEVRRVFRVIETTCRTQPACIYFVDLCRDADRRNCGTEGKRCGQFPR